MIGVCKLVIHLVDIAGLPVQLGEFLQNLHLLGRVVEVAVAASHLVQGVVGVEGFQFLALLIVGDGIVEFALHEVAVAETGECVGAVFVLFDVGGEIFLERLLSFFVGFVLQSGVSVGVEGGSVVRVVGGAGALMVDLEGFVGFRIVFGTVEGLGFPVEVGEVELRVHRVLHRLLQHLFRVLVLLVVDELEGAEVGAALVRTHDGRAFAVEPLD